MSLSESESHLWCYSDRPILRSSEGSVGLCELCQMMLPTINQLNSKTGGYNLVKGSQHSNVRETLDINIR